MNDASSESIRCRKWRAHLKMNVTATYMSKCASSSYPTCDAYVDIMNPISWCKYRLGTPIGEHAITRYAVHSISNIGACHHFDALEVYSVYNVIAESSTNLRIVYRAMMDATRCNASVLYAAHGVPQKLCLWVAWNGFADLERKFYSMRANIMNCLLYTSDAADE